MDSSLAIPMIPGLPEHLRVVPSWMDNDDDHYLPRADRELWRPRWFSWREQLIDYRLSLWKKADRNPSIRPEQMRLSAEDPAYWGAVYGWIFEPRDTEWGEPAWYSWVPFPHQVLMDRWLQTLMTKRGPEGHGIIEKSRDMGATWEVCKFIAHQWLFAPRAFMAGLISYKADVVDDGTPDSMFFKIEGLLGIEGGDDHGIPPWMRPKGFDPKIHDKLMKLEHPSHASKFIRGEPTTARSGRGSRVTIRVNDEGAHFEELKQTLTAQMATTNHVITLSSAELKYGDHFQKMAQDASQAQERGERGLSYLRLDYWMQPTHTKAWLADQELSYTAHGDPEGFQREVMIDYEAGFSDYIYRAAAVGRPYNVPFTYDPENPDQILYVGIDPGRRDDTAIVFAVYDRADHIMTWLDSYENNLKPAEFYAHILTGIPAREADADHEADVCWAWLSDEKMSPRSRSIMEFTSALSWNAPRVVYVMDPAGAQRTISSAVKASGTAGQAFHEVVMTLSLELREREVAAGRAQQTPSMVAIYHEHLFGSTQFTPRHKGLRTLLTRSQFADTPGARAIRDALLKSHYGALTKNITTDPKPVHDAYSHIKSGAEYIASTVDAGIGWMELAQAGTRKPVPVRKPTPQRRKAA